MRRKSWKRWVRHWNKRKLRLRKTWQQQTEIQGDRTKGTWAKSREKKKDPKRVEGGLELAWGQERKLEWTGVAVAVVVGGRN